MGKTPQIYIINLCRRPERKQFMQEQATRLGLQVSFIDAVDGGDPDSLVRMGPEFGNVTGKPRSRLDYACVTSHLKCLEELCASGAPYGIILEDDVFLSDDFKRLADFDWVPEDADVVKLETVLTPVKLRNVRSNRSIGRRIGRLESRHLGAGGYMISARAARRLLDEMSTPYDQIDQILFFEHIELRRDLVVYQVIPAPVLQGMYQKDVKDADWAESTLEPDRAARGIGRRTANAGIRHRAKESARRIRANLFSALAFLRNDYFGVVKFK